MYDFRCTFRIQSKFCNICSYKEIRQLFLKYIWLRNSHFGHFTFLVHGFETSELSKGFMRMYHLVMFLSLKFTDEYLHRVFYATFPNQCSRCFLYLNIRTRPLYPDNPLSHHKPSAHRYTLRHCTRTLRIRTQASLQPWKPVYTERQWLFQRVNINTCIISDIDWDGGGIRVGVGGGWFTKGMNSKSWMRDVSTGRVRNSSSRRVRSHWALAMLLALAGIAKNGYTTHSLAKFYTYFASLRAQCEWNLSQ